MSTTNPVSIPRLIKVIVNLDMHDLVRVAAALQRKSLRKFARDAVVAETKRLTAGLRLQAASRKKSK
jgi:uncharacterized protein (DUF1778 family)